MIFFFNDDMSWIFTSLVIIIYFLFMVSRLFQSFSVFTLLWFNITRFIYFCMCVLCFSHLMGLNLKSCHKVNKRKTARTKQCYTQCIQSTQQRQSYLDYTILHSGLVRSNLFWWVALQKGCYHIPKWRHLWP